MSKSFWKEEWTDNLTNIFAFAKATFDFLACAFIHVKG